MSMKTEEELKNYANDLMTGLVDEDDVIARANTTKIVVESYKEGYHDGVESKQCANEQTNI